MRWIRTAVPLALAGLIGCGSDDDGAGATLVPVSGTITRNNKPLADASVSFIPDAANKPSTPGTDSTGPDGNYKLRYKSRSGIAPGKYKVVVTPAIETPGAGKVPDAFKDDPYMAQMATGVGVPGARKETAIAKDVAGAKSEFEADVDAKGGVFDFDVKTSSSGASKK
jgi:hypothetical protein